MAGNFAGQTFSQFGGLWVDQKDAPSQLAKKVQLTDISEEIASQIADFMQDGYVVIKSAVPTSLTRAIREEIERFWQNPPEDAFIEHWAAGIHQYVRPRPEHREGSTKLLDFYRHSVAAREAITAPKVVKFLSAILASRPKVFQSLTFWKGSEQAIHKDTAYVRIQGEPMRLAATWLALEDVQEGSGELEYYVGSHRDPDFLFGGRHKWMIEAPEQHDEFLASLHRDAIKYNRPKRSFLGKEGDVLIWHADLAHGGAPITKPGVTRQSLVSHFTTAKEEPAYRARVSWPGLEHGGCTFISEYGPII